MPQHPASATEELKRYDVLRGNLVKYNSKPEARRFEWTDAGKSAYVTLRRCLYLQHTKTPWQSGGNSWHNTALDDASGAARCRDVLGSLAKASATFLNATWTELQQMVWAELRDFVNVMKPFDKRGANDTAAEAALVHIWGRLHVWMALHRAPSDLLGNLNEALVLVMAPDALGGLRQAVALLLEAWQEGLVQIGDQLAVAVTLLADGGLSDEQRIPWLLNWRLYLIIHRHMAVWTNTHHVPCWHQHQRAQPIYPYQPRLHDALVESGWPPQGRTKHADGSVAPRPLDAGPQPLTAEHVAAVRTSGGSGIAGTTPAHRHGPGVGVQGGSTAAQVGRRSAEYPGAAAAEVHDDGAHQEVGMHAATQPRKLLTYFMAMCAEKAMKLVLPFLAVRVPVGRSKGKAPREAELETASAAAWARYVERRVGELLAREAAAHAAVRCAEGGDAEFAHQKLDRVSLLHFALFLSAGRLRALAAELECHSAAGGAWTSAGRGGRAAPWQLQLPPAPASAKPSADVDGGIRLSDPGAPSGTSALSEAYLASSFFRFSVLQLAVMSCAAATNRLAHVPNTHCPGSSADLKSLCLAHSDAVTLGSAAELLLAVAQALSLQLWGAAPPAGGGQPRAAAPAAAAALIAAAPAAAAVHDEHGANGGAGFPGVGPPSGKGPRLPRKLNWRRSLRRILPAVMGGIVEGHGDDAPGPPGARGCWASDAIAPAPQRGLPLQGPAYNCELRSTDEARKAMKKIRKAADDAGNATRGLPPRGPGGAADAKAAPQPAVQQRRVAREVGDGQPGGDAEGDAGGGGRPRSSPSMPPAAQELLPVWRGGLQQSTTSTVVTPVPLSAAETGLLCLLHSLCEQLNAAAARAADLLVMEMTHRAGMLYAPPKGKGAAPPSGIQPVVEKLLKPLRDAVVDLHPTTQAQLLAVNFSAVLAVLRQHHCGVGGGGGGALSGALSSLSSFKGRSARSGLQKGADREQQLQQDLGVLRGELERICAQVDAALGNPSCGTTASGAAGALVRQDFRAVQAELEAKMQTLERECAARQGSQGLGL
ncbi:hypothetical protein TSOC_005998 [Tetrabaena socialis]|uniref:Uncharacterized protein n=1 Tax=Tetrabaena socialis TaxID=47790 RepID=A0A2J8A4U0_9CHLO|nr:hypothetical protein TSOC_005998 [Tetrabaena socialis]|eukprot:PNH07531.1 hypothetical protein TSOC_005998 [Tetrabaena socialis]